MKYQNRLKDKIQCTLCPRNCTLQEGQTGFCNVRKNTGNAIELITYGYTTGLAVDPIEKKPLYHFLPASKTLSFGTVGCNMGCKFCQNHHSSKASFNESVLLKITPKEIVEAAILKGCKSVAFTYNDPVIFTEFAIDTAIEAHKNGLKTVAVTAGYINEAARRDFFEHIDAVNVDLKAFQSDFYSKHCSAQFSVVLETLEYIKHMTNCWLEITTLLIEGENDSDKEIRSLCEYIKGNLSDTVPVHFSAFFPAYKFTNKNITTPQTLFRAYEIAKSIGLKYVYTGNIVDSVTSATYCKKCSNPIIVRSSYHVAKVNLREISHCNFCNTVCDGVFES